MSITIYSTPTCHYCQQAKMFFHEHDLEYKEINVKEDLEARKEMIKKSGQMGVPVIEMNGKVFTGFNLEQLENELKK